MNRIEAQRRMVQAFTLLLEGEEKRAMDIIRTLDEADISRLRTRGQDLAIVAENIFFDKRRDTRAHRQ